MKTTSLLLFLSLLLLAPAVRADDPYCLVPRDVDTTGQRWNLNTTVRVWIAPSVHPDLQSAVVNAVHSWGNHPDNSSGVSFTFVYAEPVTGSDTLIFRQAPLSSPAQYSMDPQLKRATVTLNSGITNATAAEMTVAHEMGHTFGTLDCWQCESGTSVMVERPADLNDTSSLIAPTDCDLVAAMVAMGATKQRETGETPVQTGDNEPACFDKYHRVKVCWFGICLTAIFVEENGYCFQ